MDTKIVRIMELVVAKEDGTVEFSEESKKLIHEVAKECRMLPLYERCKDGEAEYKKGLTAGLVYRDMCNKIILAPTPLYMKGVPRTLLPIIDDLLQEESRED